MLPSRPALLSSCKLSTVWRNSAAYRDMIGMFACLLMAGMGAYILLL